MTKTLLWIAISILAVYALIPGIMIRMFGYRAFKRGSRQNDLALTFDDGPDEVYTGRLLDMLQKHNVKATFFVVGKNAETHPELILRMHKEGHTIGIHNYVHHTNWLLLPQQVRRQIEQTAEVVRRITGNAPIYYRPPWGIINVFDFMTLRKFRLILWSRIVGDWRKNNDKAKLKRKLIKRLKGGEVIVLHDSGETFGAYRHAPEQMLQALDEYLQEVKGKGYSFVTIDEMFRNSQAKTEENGVGSRMFIFLFMQWEKLFHLLFKVKKVDPENPILQ
ncbi:MAG TPA: polysaccharide deacetylase family protein, partial [Bacilli bacterium]